MLLCRVCICLVSNNNFISVFDCLCYYISVCTVLDFWPLTRSHKMSWAHFSVTLGSAPECLDFSERRTGPGTPGNAYLMHPDLI